MRDTYRFRGSVRPHEGIRASVLTSDAAEDGIAVLRLYDPIDSWGGEWGVSAKEFAGALDQLPADTRLIRLHLNSPGGEVFEAITIKNMLRAHSARLEVVVDGIAASAASFLAASADLVTMAPNSQMMIHDAWGICIGSAEVMHSTGDLLDRISDNIASIYAARSGAPVEQWRAAMLAETWYSAEEAVSAGLADLVGDAGSAPKASFDLSAFRYAGRSEAPGPAHAAALPESTRARHRLNGRRHDLA